MQSIRFLAVRKFTRFLSKNRPETGNFDKDHRPCSRKKLPVSLTVPPLSDIRKNAACQPKPQRPPVPSRLSGPKESSGSVQRTPLPFPNYVVFYNGNAEEPDETMLCLSEAFLLPDQDCTPAVECRVRVLNINQGHNRELMEQCRRLWEYAEFIECIRNNLKDGLP